ncbi:hypothetical protein LDENG_00250740 [Lucifuga dentata]|nr:hypothetical protein LDENG_00250740 [Lucifuga dentata]
MELLFALSKAYTCRIWFQLSKPCRNRNEKGVLDKNKYDRKSIQAEMGVAYMDGCVSIQGIQEKKNFENQTHGSKIISQKAKVVIIAPPSGQYV